MKNEMTSVERVRAAIELRTPDRVPVDLHNFQPAAYVTGLPMSQVFKDGELLAQAMLTAWREFGHDMILLENGTACNAQACGAVVTYRDDGAPVADQPLLTKLEDVANLAVPDPYTTFPMCEILKATRILSKELGDQAWICARADQGPMDLAAQLRGLNEFMVDVALGQQAELIHQLLDYARRVATRYAYALIECGGHSTSIGEPVGGPDLISPKHYRRYPLAHEQKMVEELKAHNIILHVHICGNTVPILADFISTGAPVLEVDHKTNPQKIKDAARHKTCLLGNIDTLVMATGTVGEVDDACRELIEVWKPDSGFILGPGCALGATTPAENIHALVESAKKYGVYS
ncbi:MAG: uroporphyrinogen decarboxylase family protein [Thermoflexales bacterium]|nr:uroporphyrinogen decarboxylase family protein [Thermoflexales bacterium]